MVYSVTVPFLAIVVGLIGCLGAATSGAELSVVPALWCASRENPPAVICDDAGLQPAAFAKAELQRYLERILGTQLPEQPASPSKPIIRLSIQYDSELGDDGYEFVGEGNVFHIKAGSPLSLVFGNYEFLRRYGGCRFSDLGSDGEHVPRLDHIDAPRGLVRVTPKLWYRGLQFYRQEDPALSRQQIDWMAKNGFNYVLYGPAPEGVKSPDRFTKEWFDRELLPEVRRRGLKLDMNLHNLLYWMPTNRYLAAHPEWYALSNGQRAANLNQLCLCTSNPEAVRTLIENVKRYLRENPEVKIVGVIPEDYTGGCECGRCAEVDAKSKAASAAAGIPSGDRTKSSRYHRILRAVADAIRDDFPDVSVGGEAYGDLLWPAPNVPLPQNIIVWLAVFYRDYARPLAPGRTSAVNQRFLDAIQEWKKVYRGRLTLYEYTMGRTRQTTLPHPIAETLCEDWLHLRKLGVEGATLQCFTGEFSAYALNNLAFARAAWHERVDPRQVLDDYLLGAFGSAGTELRPIFQTMFDGVRQQGARGDNVFPEADTIRFYINAETMPGIHQAMARAQVKAAAGRERRQVEKLAAAVRYWELAAEFFELRAVVNRLVKSDRAAAQAPLDRALKTTWPAIQAQMDSLPSGWLGSTAREKWDDLIKDMAKNGRTAP